MPPPYPKVIHRLDALSLLSDGLPHRLRVWKLSTGEVLLYPRAVRLGRHTRGGKLRVRLHPSGAIRALRECCLFEIDDMKIYW